MRVEVPPSEVRDGVLTASVLVVDRFGNVALSARPDDLTGIGVDLGGEVELTAGEGRFLARRARTFGDVRHGDMVVYDDASGWVGVAVNGSSLAAACGIVPGDVVELEAAVTLPTSRPDDARWIALWNEVWPPLATTAGGGAAWHARAPRRVRGAGGRDGRVTGRLRPPEPSCRPGSRWRRARARAERRAGRGTALLGVARARAAALGATGLRGHLWIGPDGEGRAALDWAGRAGFAETARELVVALSLREREPPAVDPPDGVRIVSWADDPGLAPQLHAIASEAIPDIPGEEDAVVPPLEEWLRNDMSGPYDRPEAVLVALAGDEAVGYAKLHLPAARGDVRRTT